MSEIEKYRKIKLDLNGLILELKWGKIPEQNQAIAERYTQIDYNRQFDYFGKSVLKIVPKLS